MIKKLLPTMIGAALVGGMTTAAADVTVFGHLDTSINNVDTEIAGVSADDTNFHCTTCSVGFKGSEDLGNGLKAIFKLDFQFDTINRNSNGSITDRDQWLGLAGGFGQVRIGSISTVYKSHGAMIDPLYRTFLQGRDHGLQSPFHSSAGEELQGRADNTVRWDSVDFNGVKLGAHYTLDSDETDGEDDNPYGIGGSYSNGGILVFADWMTNDGSTTNPAGDLVAWKIGGKYSMNNIAVMGQYENAEDDTISEEGTLWHIAGTYTMGNNTLYAGYGQGEIEVPGVTVDTDAWTIAAMHKMSKRTMVYAGYNKFEEDDPIGLNIEEDTFSLGMKHKF